MDSPLEIIQALGRTAQLTWTLLSAHYTRTPGSIDRGMSKSRPKRHRRIEQSAPIPPRFQFHKQFPEEIIFHVLGELCVKDIRTVGLVSLVKLRAHANY